LMLRLYWPDESSPSIINGSWVPPKVTKATDSSTTGARHL
jgi:hypothetical protein